MELSLLIIFVFFNYEWKVIKLKVASGFGYLCFGLVVVVPLLTLGSLAELEKHLGFYEKFPGVANFVRFDKVERVIISIFGIYVGLNCKYPIFRTGLDATF